MSAFLGPIHYWLYRKIQIQQDIIVDILSLPDLPNNHLNNILDDKYGKFDTLPLENIIDLNNIHGWLQSRVSMAEYKLAYCISYLLESNPKIFDEIKKVFHDKGKELGKSVPTKNAGELFKSISDCLLDGMPCDHANSIIEETEDKILWMRNTCVHKSYWEEVGGDIQNYYQLREEFIQGFLAGKPFSYRNVDGVTNVIERSIPNE